MGLITDPYTFVDGDPIVASQPNERFDTIYNEFNGNIDNANIKTGAAIALSKLDLTSELLIKVASGRALSAGVTGDTTGRVSLNASGLITFGTGGSQDMALKREDANTLAVRDAGDSVYKSLKVNALTASGALSGTGLTLSSTFSGTSGSFSGALTAASMSLSAALPVGSGGTGLTAFTPGDLVYCSATNTLNRLPIGSNGQTLQVVAGVPTWVTGGSVFQSSDQSITLGGGLTIAHGLGAAPKQVWSALVNQTAEAGYSPGEVVFFTSIAGGLARSNNSYGGTAITVDTTNIYPRFCSEGYTVVNKTTGVISAIIIANWKMRFYAQ